MPKVPNNFLPLVTRTRCFCGRELKRDKGNCGATCSCGRIYANYGSEIGKFLIYIGRVSEYDFLGM
jgi:hypothetical protein